VEIFCFFPFIFGWGMDLSLDTHSEGVRVRLYR
jgi:hypothetical protein